ncbi:MAG: putative glycosyltransferase [Verrucomicrobia bacterium]|jgi:glycosyltransferase involved in cell wall biosynthesis|nr:putative glycosyltransferase [Verrucomicrobiota bacterium]
MSVTDSTARGNYVSVVIPAYNRAHYIHEALDSVFAQGPCIGEIIVVDDGSTDGTVETLQAIKDSRLKVVRQTNQGAAAARQRGWLECQGAWVIFLDSDDALEPGCVEKQLAAAKENPGAVVYARTSIHEDQVTKPPSMVLSFSQKTGDVLQDLCFYSGGTIFSAIFSAKALEAVGGFFPEKTDCVSEDIDFAVRLAVRFPFVFLPIITYRTRNHPANTYKNREFQQRIYLSAQQVMAERLPKAPKYWLLRARSQAYFLGLAAQVDEELGRPAKAKVRYLQSLKHWPIKLGAWKGLWRTKNSKVAKA